MLIERAPHREDCCGRSSTASAGVGAPTSGAAGVGRAPGARTEGSTPGRVATLKRRGSPKALAGRTEREVAHLCTSDVRAGYSG